jgi:hypothetical protein
MVAYSQAKFNVCRNVVALAQQQALQHRSCSSFLFYACTKQRQHHREHELNASCGTGI